MRRITQSKSKTLSNELNTHVKLINKVRAQIIAIPRQWATVLEEHNLSNVEVSWVTLAMIKDFKSFLQLRYVSRNEDIEKQRFEVKNIAWLNFGYGEEVDDNEEL